MKFPSYYNLLADAVADNGDSEAFKAPYPSRIEVRITGTGAVSATVSVYGRIHPAAEWEKIGADLSLTGTAKDSATITNEFPYYQYKLTVASLTGTGAAVNVAACA